MGARGWNFRVWSCPCDALPGDMSPLLLRPPNVPLSFSSQTPDPKSQNSSQSLDSHSLSTCCGPDTWHVSFHSIL